MNPWSSGFALVISRRTSGPTCTACSQPRFSGGRKKAEITVSAASETYIHTALLMSQAWHRSDTGRLERS